MLKTIAILCVATALVGAPPAWAENYRNIPKLDVQSSCNEAQKFSAQGDNKGVVFKGCMQDEMNAKDQLAKSWSTFKTRDKQTCVEQARAPSPSYVEVLTCLEMGTKRMSSGGTGAPPIGGPQAPGLAQPDRVQGTPAPQSDAKGGGR